MRGLWAACLAMLALMGAARAETMITSLSTHRLQITSNFVGADIVLFGGIERDAYRTMFSLDDETLEQRDVLEPAAAVLLEEIAQHIAASRLIGGEADEAGTLVGSLHCALGQNAPDLIRLVIA